jgi:hypothetical protein
MNNQFDELTKSMAARLTGRKGLKKFRVVCASVALGYLGIVTSGQAQTSVLCDPPGDGYFSNGHGSAVPPWLDIVQGTVTAAGDEHILFTLTVAAAVPQAPAWKGVEEGGLLTWGWRLIGNLGDITIVKNGCLGSNGENLPGAYYLDLFWSVQTSSFQALLVDNTTCTETLVPFAFSADRTQILLLVRQGLLANKVLIPDPANFQYAATTVVWKSNSVGNHSFTHVDWAPNLTDAGGVVVATWSAFSNSSHSCP